MEYLDGEPYLQGTNLNKSGCLAFVLGIALGIVNLVVTQFSEKGESIWEESKLGFDSRETLDALCTKFIERFIEHKNQERSTGTRAAPVHPPSSPSKPGAQPK